MADLIVNRTALAMILPAVSAIPIGHTPGFLLSAIRQHASRGAMHFGSMSVVQILFATRDREEHSSTELALYCVQSRLQLCLSTPICINRVKHYLVYVLYVQWNNVFSF